MKNRVMKMKNNKDENLITRKIKYSVATKQEQQDILILQNKYSNILHFTYNRLFENNKLSTKEISALQKQMNNVDINCHFFNSAIYDAKSLIAKDTKNPIIFGGKKLFFDRLKAKISKKDYKLKKLSPIFSMGESNQKGNRLFDIIDDKTILFKPSRDKHIELHLTTSKEGKKELLKLKNLMNKKEISVTITLNQEYICLTFDYNRLNIPIDRPKIKNRIFAIDQNPNYIGWTVIDWTDGQNYKIIDKGVISNKPLNDKWFALKNKNIDSSGKRRTYITNKRKYEVCKIGQYLVNLANHYQCDIFGLEKLTIKGSDKGKGKHFNSLCNNVWCRNVLYSQLRKFCNFYGIRFQEVLANYSSFIGNLIYRSEQLPDMVLSSIEISRRAYEFYHQYIVKDKKVEKNIVLPDLTVVKQPVLQSLEELKQTSDKSTLEKWNKILNFSDLRQLFSLLKKSKQKYRLLLEDLSKSRVFSKNYKKSAIILYSFI